MLSTDLKTSLNCYGVMRHILMMVGSYKSTYETGGSQETL